MTYDDRASLVSLAEETYALAGHLLASEIPVALGAVRPEVVDELRDGTGEPFISDAGKLERLRKSYEGSFEHVLQLQEELLSPDGERYDEPLSQVGLTDDELRVDLEEFRRELGQFL